MNRKLIALNLLLVVLLGAAGWEIKQRWEQARQREKALAAQKPPAPPTPAVPKAEPIAPSPASNYIDIAQKEGAKLACGGGTPKDQQKGYFVEPTIFTNCTNDMRIAKEEVFGPVLAVIPFKTVEEVAEQANKTTFGLSGAVWTKDVKKAHKLAAQIKAGTIWVNCYNAFDPAVPFGGYKMSGYGRELGKHSIELYSNIKSVWVNLQD